MVNWSSVAGLRAEISLVEVWRHNFKVSKVCHSQPSNIHNSTVLWPTELQLYILEIREQGQHNGKRFSWLLSLPELWKWKEVWESWISDNFSPQKSRSVFCILRSRGGQEEAETFSIVKVMISHFQNGKLKPCSWSGCWDILHWSWILIFAIFDFPINMNVLWLTPELPGGMKVIRVTVRKLPEVM